ncbi:MAG: 3-dehydroquinate synthase [Chlamydiae bacterium]|nr:3-dehydroquinate synthase [Chlamydiota bacterium]MBI3265694.1 3-dehydroquinate synthase [Chlamydiota bacterium]
MEIVRVDLGQRSYEVMIGIHLIEKVGELISHLGLGSSCALVTHERLFKLFGDSLIGSLKGSRKRVYPIFVPEGEHSKSFEWAERIYQVMLDSGLDRSSFVVALGGGVVGDLAGFVAGTYMRGIDLVQVPTTFLAQVDASLGGKTAINLAKGKNLVGVFHQPKLVLVDVATLEHLNPAEYRSGLGEVVKYGVIKDVELFEFLESHAEEIMKRDFERLQWVIHHSVSVKALVVSQDERESHLRAILNYGHTLGHALEAATRYGRYKHGEAISIGMMCAAWMAKERGFLKEEDFNRQTALLKKYGLPLSYKKPKPREVYSYLGSDKKKRQGVLTFVLPKKIGEVFLCRDVSEKAIMSALEKFHR